MEKKKDRRGGYRPGARRPVEFEQGLVTRSVTLPPEYAEYLKELGEGNFSAGVRRLVEERMKVEGL